MESKKEKKEAKSKVTQIHCPCCHATLWYDSVTSEVIKSEKEKKKKGSLDELLIKEKKKKSDIDRRFTSTAELEKEKRKEALKKFEKAFTELDEED